MGEEEICCWDCRQSFLPKNWPRHRNSLRHLRQILRPRPWGWGRERRPATERFRPGRRGADGCTDARTWPVRELGGRRRWFCCIGPFPRARTAAATGAGPLGRAAHEPTAQPRLGIERPLPLPLAQLLKPLMRSYTTANATAPLCGGVRRHAMVGTRRECPGETGYFSYDSGVQTRRVYKFGAFVHLRCGFASIASRRVRSNLNNFIRYSWKMASRTGGNQIPRVLPLSGHLCSSPVRWAYFDDRRNHLRVVVGKPVNLPEVFA